MKILHCFFSFKTGGAESMLVDIINEQIKTSNVELMIINNVYDTELLNSINKNVKVIFLGRNPGSIPIMVAIKLNYYLFTKKYDIIHIHDEAIINFILPNFKNTYLTLHTTGINASHLHRFKKVIAISDHVKCEMEARCNRNIDIVENGVAIDKVKKRISGVCDGDFKIVQVGRLDISIKGQDILIKALSILKNRGYDNVHAYFIGEGKDEHTMHAIAEELGVERNIHILGKQNKTQIYDTLCEYDLMCHPARIEGFGLVIVEGSAAMLPVLVPNHSGAYEVIEKGEYGFVFEKENPEACADKIEWLMGNYMEAQRVIENAYANIVKKYSLKNTVDKYYVLYNKN